MAAIGVPGRGLVVFLQKLGVDQLLPGVVDDLPLPVHQVEIPLPGAQLHILADLLDTPVVHIHQEDPFFHRPAAGQLHLAAEGDHPPVAVVRVHKKVLDMGGGKVEVFHLLPGGGKPALPLGGGARLQAAQGGGGLQPALLGEDGDGNQVVPVALVKELQLLGKGLLPQVGALDDLVVGGVRYPHHPPEVGVQIQVHLGEDPLAGLGHLGVGGGGKAQEEAHPQKDHPRHRRGGKGEGEDKLDAGAAVDPGPAAPEGGQQLAHLASPFPVPPDRLIPRRQGRRGIWWGSCQSAF